MHMLQRTDENQQVAAQLREAAALLHAQGANPFRVSAYRKAADTLARLDQPVRRIFDAGGRAGLEALPNVGPGIAGAIAEMLVSGSWSQLARLRGAADPETLFLTVPGIGPGLAHAVHEALQADTLEALEAAAHDGRLEGVPGVGPRRAAAIRAALASMLGRRIDRASGGPAGSEPSAAALLEVDREYRDGAAAGKLRMIAPKRFNPEGRSWLPVLHTQRGDWHFTALYSNTARAHELGRTRDWVVIYFYDGDHVEGQHTVVTESRGPLAGSRVVRGREAECRAHYAAHAPAAQAA
jgi:DNA polymerase (family 10)